MAAIADLGEERQSRRRFLELETRGGDGAAFAEGLAGLGCEVAELPNRRLKVILSESVPVRELYRFAAERGVQLRSP